VYTPCFVQFFVGHRIRLNICILIWIHLKTVFITKLHYKMLPVHTSVCRHFIKVSHPHWNKNSNCCAWEKAHWDDSDGRDLIKLSCYSSGRIILLSKISPHSLMFPGRTHSPILYVWSKTQPLSCFAPGQQLWVHFLSNRSLATGWNWIAHNRHNRAINMHIHRFNMRHMTKHA